MTSDIHKQIAILTMAHYKARKHANGDIEQIDQVERSYDAELAKLRNRDFTRPPGEYAGGGYRWRSNKWQLPVSHDEAATMDQKELRSVIDEWLEESLVRTLPVPAKFDERPPQRDWLVDGWIPIGDVTLFTGKGGSGKSTLAMQLAAAVATGGQYCALSKSQNIGDMTSSALWRIEYEPASVLYISYEDGNDEAARRIHAINAPIDDLGDRLRYLYLGGKGALWQPMADGSKHTSTLGEWSLLAHDLFDLAHQCQPRLLVLDPLAAVYACNENDRALVRGFMSALALMSKQLGCATLLIAHPSKDKDHEFSGSTDWHSAARSVISLERKQEGKGKESHLASNPTLSQSKSSYGRLQTKCELQPSDPNGLSAWIETKPNAREER